MVPDQAFKEGVDHGIFKLIWDTAQGYCYRLINYRNSNCIVLYYNSNFFLYFGAKLEPRNTTIWHWTWCALHADNLRTDIKQIRAAISCHTRVKQL